MSNLFRLTDDGRVGQQSAGPSTVKIDATYRKTDPTTTSLRSKKGGLATGAVV